MSGEHQEGRRAMDQLVGSMVKSGVPVERAKQKAREAAIRHDRKANK